MSASSRRCPTGPRLFHFESNVKAGNEGTYRITGEVTLDSENRVAKIVFKSRLTLANGQLPPVRSNVPQRISIAEVVMEFSGYGEPVSDEPPKSAG